MRASTVVGVVLAVSQLFVTASGVLVASTKWERSVDGNLSIESNFGYSISVTSFDPDQTAPVPLNYQSLDNGDIIIYSYGILDIVINGQIQGKHLKSARIFGKGDMASLPPESIPPNSAAVAYFGKNADIKTLYDGMELDAFIQKKFSELHGISFEDVEYANPFMLVTSTNGGSAGQEIMLEGELVELQADSKANEVVVVGSEKLRSGLFCFLKGDEKAKKIAVAGEFRFAATISYQKIQKLEP